MPDGFGSFHNVIEVSPLPTILSDISDSDYDKYGEKNDKNSIKEVEDEEKKT